MPRKYCQRCKKPESACLCCWVTLQHNNVAVLVLQHPDESKKPIGTANLIKLGLSRCHILSELNVSEDKVVKSLSEMSAKCPLLIYPKSLSDSLSHYSYDFEKDRFTSLPLQNHHDSIILLDGTWRNTRELLHRNPCLRNIPTLSLENAGHSRYRIRQANLSGALATIEAVSLALKVLDDDIQSESLLLPFEKMIEFQIDKMGQDVFLRNYRFDS